MLSGSILTLLAFAACGDERPKPTNSFSTSGGAVSGGSPGFGDASVALPGCGEQESGGYCDCVDAQLFTDPPNLYFVLDRSGSMADDNKWTQVRGVVAQILRGLGPRANFGATVFPGFAQESCAPAVEVLPISPGDPPGHDGPTTRKLLSKTTQVPYGGTPTAAALRGVLASLKQAPGKTFVILATDGGPNCDATATCAVSECMPNIEAVDGCPAAGPTNCCARPAGFPESCLDAANTISAVASLKAAGFPTYVVGLPGTATYAALLNQLATTAGTAKAGTTKYYAVASSKNDELLLALKKIAAQITATCEFALKEAPAQPDRVNVYFDEQVVAADPVNGWKIEGSKVTLLGASCTKVLNGDVLDVRIIAGCPTVEPR
ncbi:MAG: CglB [Labilithrix sp.]|nr:CglB [Labilithrix sp.]